jgi:hypothetical protein
LNRGQEKAALVPRRKKSASITFLAGCLGRQPGDEPGAEESEHYSNEGAGNGEPEWNRLP